jgi:predicted dehydrogenase
MTAHEYPIYPTTSQSAYQIGGSQGALSVPDLTLWSHNESRDWWTPISATSVPRDTSDPLINQMAHFAAVIRGQEAPLVSGREGLRSLAVVDAIQKSAKSNVLVHLEVADGDGVQANKITNRSQETIETNAKIAK